MRNRLCIFLLSFFTATVNCQQPIGSWSDHLSYNTAVNVVASQEKIFASTGTSVIVFNKEFSELSKLSPVNGLSETGIAAISWSEENEVLIIAYKNTNVDLVYKSTIFNITDILNASAGEKRINRIRTSGRYAYLATNFGIIVIDLVKKEIRDTWRPAPDSENNEVFDITFGNNKIFAATNLGVWFADLSNQGLAYFGNWDQMAGIPVSRCTLSIFCGGKLYVNVTATLSEGDNVYAAGSETILFSNTPGVQNRSFDSSPGGFTISSAGSVRYFDAAGSIKKSISSYGWGIPDISQAIVEDDNIWIADKNFGLIEGDKMVKFTNLTLTGPASNYVGHIASLNGKTVICAGGSDYLWNPIGRAFQVSVHENNKFINILSGTGSDAMRGCIDPNDINHFYISTWGDGLFEYRNNNPVNHYDETNSPLLNNYSGGQGVKICGIASDKPGNLWVTQTGSKGNILILKPDGNWIDYPLPVDSPVMGDIISTSRGQKWIILPGEAAVFVLDDNNSPDIFTDDKYIKLIIKDTGGDIFYAFSLSEDLDGNIWIGTDKGPVVYYNPEKIFDSDESANRIKIPRNDGSGLADYMLGTETITSISVDGADRKWLGTSGSGVYLLSSDGTEVLKAFNRRNSPLFSDSIATVAVDNKTGEVWFGTSEGVLSVRETATAGEQKFTNVYSFPNPVREDFTGNVTITGLLKDTEVRITDISGNLVYVTASTGGQASWDLTTFNGKRVATGVYLVFCASDDGSQSCVTKILIISR
jgi:hypothetical protein